MAAVPRSLADIVDVAMARHEVSSGRALAKEAAKMGLAISYTTLNQLHNGKYHRQLDPDTRHVLHRLSGVSERKIAELAGQREPGVPFDLPASADELTKDQREAVLGVVRAFVKANRSDTSPKPAGRHLEAVAEHDEQAAGRRADRRGQPEPELP